MAHIHKWGKNSAVGTGAKEIIAESPATADPFQLADNDTLQIVSDDAADQMGFFVSGGLWKDGNGDWVERRDSIVLNGLTPVDLNQDLIRVSRFWVPSTNTGNIYVCNSTATFASGVPEDDTDILAVIAAGRLQSECAFWTIPAGYGENWFLWTWHFASKRLAAATPREVDVDLWFARPGESFRIADPDAMVSSGSSRGKVEYDLAFPDKDGLPPHTDIKIDAQASTECVVVAGLTMANRPRIKWSD